MMNEHALPSSLPPDECMVFVGGPRFRGMYRVDRPTILESNQKIVEEAERRGFVGYEKVRDDIMQGLYHALIVSTATPDSSLLQNIGAMAVWIVWNDPVAAPALPTLRWLTFGADPEGFLMRSGDDDAEFEESRRDITEQLTGEAVVKH